MSEAVEKLRKEIEDLEKQLAANPFGGLFDRNRQEQILRKLKKKRKELAGLEKQEAKPSGKGSAAREAPGKKKARSAGEGT